MCCNLICTLCYDILTVCCDIYTAHTVCSDTHTGPLSKFFHNKVYERFALMQRTLFVVQNYILVLQSVFHLRKVNNLYIYSGQVGWSRCVHYISEKIPRTLPPYCDREYHSVLYYNNSLYHGIPIHIVDTKSMLI